jgi:hypothetical protein
MRYVVMYRGSMILRTDDIKRARDKMEKLGDTAYIQYSKKGISDYMTLHQPLKGANET